MDLYYVTYLRLINNNKYVSILEKTLANNSTEAIQKITEDIIYGLENMDMYYIRENNTIYIYSTDDCLIEIYKNFSTIRKEVLKK